jgi:hypothetical protein
MFCRVQIVSSTTRSKTENTGELRILSLYEASVMKAAQGGAFFKIWFGASLIETERLASGL